MQLSIKRLEYTCRFRLLLLSPTHHARRRRKRRALRPAGCLVSLLRRWPPSLDLQNGAAFHQIATNASWCDSEGHGFQGWLSGALELIDDARRVLYVNRYARKLVSVRLFPWTLERLVLRLFSGHWQTDLRAYARPSWTVADVGACIIASSQSQRRIMPFSSKHVISGMYNLRMVAQSQRSRGAGRGGKNQALECAW